MSSRLTTPSRLLLTVASAIGMLLVGIIGAVAAGSGTVAPPPDIVFVASNVTGSPDALTVGPMAGRLDAPLLITDGNRLSDTTRQTLIDQHPDVVIVAGGPNTITDAVMQAIADATGLAIKDIADTPTSGVVRVYGSGRDQTAAALSGLLTAYNPRFLPVDATAVDTDLLDGKDSTTYQQRITGTCGTSRAVKTVNANGSVGCTSTLSTSGVVAVSALSAVPEVYGDVTKYISVSGYWGRYSDVPGPAKYLRAALFLPDGATITSTTYVVHDQSTDDNSCAYLAASDGTSVDLGCSLGNAGMQKVTSSHAVQIDATKAYYVRMTIDGDAGWGLLPVEVLVNYSVG